jgi:SAM-dependent methyltransferase
MTTTPASLDRFVRDTPNAALGTCTDIEALDRLLDVEGRTLVDVGCGDGALARLLAERGAQVNGLEPDPVQAKQNLDAPAIPGVTLTETDGRSIPISDDTADGVIFSRSLHHVPTVEMTAMLVEAHRVLRSDGGVLYILEPIAEGAFFDTMQPFHDETEVRADAYRALKALVPELFAREKEFHYTLPVRFASFEVFEERMAAGASFNRYQPSDIVTDEVRERFELSRTDEGYCFAQPMRINLLQTA